ncbi:unnamed protein product [Mytilus coruscus]|uniref:Endonuclease/exonuclease/phosphatase domain-containing protein n=1 Tax=Mytilus coruscus TaxID=42192 RepID=A0A6J8AHX2_MYTCO|nr:unnamed protein product [Mytilus coruscus]
MFYLCGDWNSLCGDMLDYIPGVDSLPERHVVDFKCNTYGSIFCDFLSDVSCCILNGRNMTQNDFTCVSTRGSSVVDYCIVPYERLQHFEKFSVNRASTLVDTVNGIGKHDLKGIVPDHEATEHDDRSCMTTDDILDSEITSEEVLNVLKLSKAGKSPGCDEIPMEMYKNPTAINALTQLAELQITSAIATVYSKIT